MSLDEHLVIYMVDHVANGTEKGVRDMVGTRAEAEKMLVEFIYCLKYYSTRWLRAKLYAEMVGFLHCQATYNQTHLRTDMADNVQTPNESMLEAAAGVNDHTFEDIQIPATDIYT